MVHTMKEGMLAEPFCPCRLLNLSPTSGLRTCRMRIFTMKLSCSLEVINTLSTVAGAAPLYVSFEGLNSFGALAVYEASIKDDFYTGLYVCTMTKPISHLY